MSKPEQTIQENDSNLFHLNKPHPKNNHPNYHELQSDLSQNISNKQSQHKRVQLHLPDQQEEESDYNLRSPYQNHKPQVEQRAQTRHGRHGKILIENKQGDTHTNRGNKMKLFNVEDESEEKEQSLLQTNNNTPEYEIKVRQFIPIKVTKQQTSPKVFEENNSNHFIQHMEDTKQIIDTEEEPVFKKTPELIIQYKNSLKRGKGESNMMNKKANLLDVGTAKTAAMKKNLMQGEVEKQIQYVVKNTSKASLETGANLHTSRDDLSTRGMVDSLSPVRKKRLANLKPMNEVLSRKEQKIYSLKTYDHLQQLGERQKRMVVLRNGKFAILKDNIEQRRSFIYESIGFDKCLETTITRNRGCTKFGYLDYDVETNDGYYLLSCKKMPFHLGSHYNISLTKGQFAQNSQFFLGKVQGNFTGSVFNVTSTICSDVKARQLQATICYSPAWGCCKVGARQIEIYIKNKSFRYNQLEGSDDKDKNLKDLYTIQSNRTFRKIFKYVNKKPKWIPDKEIYALNFRGKVRFSSVKNMIIVNADDKSEQALLLAKQGPDTFAFDIQYPFNPIVALAVAISSFDFKLASQ